MGSPDNLALEFKTFLSKMPLFSEVSAVSIQLLANSVKLKRIEKEQFLFLRGDPCDQAFFVRSGLVSIILESSDGRKLIINEMHKGDFFGEIGMLTDQTRSSSAVARARSDLFVIPRHVFLKVLDCEPRLTFRLLQMVMHRLRDSSDRESALAFLNAEGRLGRVLLQLANQELEKGYVTISQEELAERTGQTRQTVAKTLSKWRRAGWLITGRGRVMLLNIEALANLGTE